MTQHRFHPHIVHVLEDDVHVVQHGSALAKRDVQVLVRLLAELHALGRHPDRVLAIAHYRDAVELLECRHQLIDNRHNKNKVADASHKHCSSDDANEAEDVIHGELLE